MSHDRIDFDDLALIRAFAQIGVDCDKKISRLVSHLPKVVEESGIGIGKITQQDVAFRPTLRTVIYRQLFESEIYSHPYILLGIERDCLSIWLETPPGNEKKQTFHKSLSGILDRLQERNADWYVPSLGDRSYKDIVLKTPLIDLLVADDQSAVFAEFFQNALNDIKECGVIETLQESLR